MSLLAYQHLTLFMYMLWYQKVVEGSLAQRDESFPPSHAVTPVDASRCQQTLGCVSVFSAGVRGWQVHLQLSLLLLATWRGSRQHRFTPTCLQLRFHPSPYAWPEAKSGAWDSILLPPNGSGSDKMATSCEGLGLSSQEQRLI